MHPTAELLQKSLRIHMKTHKATQAETHVVTQVTTQVRAQNKHHGRCPIMRDIFSSDRLSEQLFTILDDHHPRDHLYVYRVVDGQPVTPALLNGRPFPDLLEYLRDHHGGGKFRLIVRRGDEMRLSGIVRIGCPIR